MLRRAPSAASSLMSTSQSPATRYRAPESGMGGSARRLAGGLARRPRTQAAVALLSYVTLAIYMSWPFVIDPAHTLLDTAGGDMTGGIALFRELAEQRQAPFLPGRLSSFDAPDGLPILWLVNFAALPSVTAMWLTTMAIGAIAMYGVFSLLAFVGSAWAMFLLVRWLTGHAGVALIIGFAFGFFPYIYSYNSFPLGHGWVLVLLVWRMLVAIDKPTTRNGVWAGVAAVFAMWWTQYWLAIGGVLWATLAVVAIVAGLSRRDLRQQLRVQAVAGALIVAFILGLLIVSAQAGFISVPNRAVTNASEFSARPPMYVVPDGSPVWRFTREFLYVRYAGPAARPESTARYTPLYLGVTTILFGVAGLLWLIRRLRRGGRAATSDPAILGALAGAAAMITALVFSGPPAFTLLGQTVPLPSSLVIEVSPAFRFLSRFGHVAMLGLCVLAAYGLRQLVHGRRSKVAAAILSAAGMLMFVDLWSGPLNTAPVTYDTVRSSYSLLKPEPPGIVAEYPLNPATATSSGPIFYQDAHDHPLFNGFGDGSRSESRKLGLGDLEHPRTVPALARLGVKYLIVQRRFEPRRSLPGLVKLGQDPGSALYRIDAEPADSLVLTASGFSSPEAAGAETFRWILAPEAELDIIASCAPCSGTLAFTATSFAEPRTMTLRDERGSVVARRRVEPGATRIEVPLDVGPKSVVTVTTDPGPAPAGDGIRSDARSLSVSLVEPATFRAVR